MKATPDRPFGDVQAVQARCMHTDMTSVFMGSVTPALTSVAPVLSRREQIQGRHLQFESGALRVDHFERNPPWQRDAQLMKCFC
jgi:hypothetical protein